MQIQCLGREDPLEKEMATHFLQSPGRLQSICVQSLQSCPTHLTIACQAPLSMELSRQEYWSGLPCPPPGDLPPPGTEPVSPVPPAPQAGSSPLETWGSPGLWSLRSQKSQTRLND